MRVVELLPIDVAKLYGFEELVNLDVYLMNRIFADDLQKHKFTPKNFKLIMPLGKGAFGEVDLVERDGQYYAMKKMEKAGQSDIALKLLMTEKEVQMRLNHRFIVKMRYSFQTSKYFYLLTDF